MNRSQRKIKRMVFHNLDKIYKTSKSVSESYGYNMISIDVLGIIISKAKLKSKDLPSDFVNNYNKVLDVLLNTCKKSVISDNLIFPESLKEHIFTIKKSFTSALNDRP